MIYEYSCWRCKTNTDVIKPVQQYNTDEYCEDCGALMEKIFCAASVSVVEFDSGYNPAFGKRFTNKQELKNELKKIHGETGKELVEVGNDAMPKTAPKTGSYDY